MRAFTSTWLVTAAIAAFGCDSTSGGNPSSGTSGSTASDAGALDAASDAGVPDSGPPLDTGPSVPADYVIVAADSLSASAERYRAFRAGTGHIVDLTLLGDLVEGAPLRPQKVDRIREHVRAHYEARDPTRPFFVLLIGDANDQIPAGEEQEPTTGDDATNDNVYADMDGDHIPDLAIGRLPASTDAEVDRMREKVQTYETTYETGLFNRRLNMFASTAGFSDTVDAAIETIVRRVLSKLSYDYDLTFTYGSQDSEYVYVPEQFSNKVYERINEGSLVTAYVGHGFEDGVDCVDWNGMCHPILDHTVLDSKLAGRNKSPVLALFACSTGSFDDHDSLAERIVRHAGGPPAVFASTEVSHPYANAILSREFAAATTEHVAPTVGELVQLAKERLANNSDDFRRSLELLVRLTGQLTAEEMDALERSHQYMYVLFGDPAMRIAYVRGRAQVETMRRRVSPGTQFDVTVQLDNLSAGTAQVTLEVDREELNGTLQTVPPDGDPTRDEVIMANYEMANDKIVATIADVPITSSSFDISVTVPPASELPAGADKLYVKVYADDGTTDAFGHCQVGLTR